MPDTTTPIAPVRKSITVAVAPRQAFELFTRDIGTWWPLATHSVGLERAASLSFASDVGDQLVETLADGTTETWGTVLQSEIPRRIAFSWHPGRSALEATHIEVTFTPGSAGGTIVELVHSGWERWEDGETQAANYREGWVLVLQSLEDHGGYKAV
jgi:Activator of Hsp90 ATPase homolog 1-like protein